jgi:RNA polymerase sigma-54 factor
VKTQFRQYAGQQLALTPQLSHSIRMLQLSSLEFEEEIEQALADNPFIERADESTQMSRESSSEVQLLDERAEADWSDRTGSDGNYDQGPSSDGSTDLTPAGVNLREHLLEQMRSCRLPLRDRALAQLIIHALEPDGYLRTELIELAQLCPPEQTVSVKELETALRRVQSFEPIGIAARDLTECLRLQLQTGTRDPVFLELALRIVNRHLNELAIPDTHRLMRSLQCSEAELAGAYQMIRTCSPKPGLPYAEGHTEYVVADVIVRKENKQWIARVNPAVVPKIYLNQTYAALYAGRYAGGSSSAIQKLHEARWFLRNVNQRFKTIERVAQAIVERQSRYLEYGDLAMKPLVLREIADAIGIHESTVSRVTCNKYMMTPRGLVELRYFFASQVESDGNNFSSTAIRALIRQIIANENPGLPLSDVKITGVLKQKGVTVARRTVSKYRDELRIPSVEVRRLTAHSDRSALATA